MLYKNSEDDRDSKSKTAQQSTATYATKLSLNCSRNIEIELGHTVELMSGYITIEPNGKLQDVQYEITTVNGVENGIKFVNNVITANSIGKYNLKFSVFKNRTQKLSDTIVVNVVEHIATRNVNLLVSQVRVDNEFGMHELFSVNNSVSNLNFITNSNVRYENSNFKFINKGNAFIEVSYLINYIKYTESFNINILPQENYVIVINNNLTGEDILSTDFNVKLGNVLFLRYAIKDGNLEHVNQVLLFEENENVTIEVTAPTIKFKFLKVGNFSVTFISQVDQSIAITLNFFVS